MAPSIEQLVPGFVPETDLERTLAGQPELLEGLAWGAPRFGHPEGPVGAHVAQIVSRIAPAEPRRAELRVIALVHDSFKRRTDPSRPLSPENDHALLAARFAARFLSDDAVLRTIELHDTPYRLWRRGGEEAAVVEVVDRVGDVPLFVRFVELDASTEGKDLSFLMWLRYALARAGRLPEAGPDGGPVALTGPRVFVQSFATTPAEQQAAAAALRALLERHRAELGGELGVLASADGLRLLVVVRWEAAAPNLEGTRALFREAFERHPELASLRPLEAHVYTGDAPLRTVRAPR